MKKTKAAVGKFAPKSADLPASPKPEDKYQIEDDARTLMRAEEIKQAGDRHGKAIKHLQGQKQAITSIEGLRDVSKEFSRKRLRGE